MHLEEIDSFEIYWDGVDLSLNKWYANRHWSYRNKEKEFWHNLFLKLLPKKIRVIEKYAISLYFNSRLDASNTIPMIKIFEDTMKEESFIIDDSKKYCKGIQVFVDESLGKKSYRLKVSILSYATQES